MYRESSLRLRRLGIDTYDEPVIYMRSDCHVCRSEGFDAHSRVRVQLNGRTIIATFHMVTSGLLKADEASLSESAWKLLDAREGSMVELSHPDPVDSLSHLRAKVYGSRLSDAAMGAIVRDVAKHLYSDIHLSAFITGCAGERLDRNETLALTRAMVDVGERLSWNRAPIVDKHSVGGLPGNRTTPIVVAIVAAAGLTMPKTSSRAITSPAGTADTMDTLAPVNLDIPAMRRVVEQEGGCIVWGGAMHLSPTDDIFIRVERPLDLDSEGQMVASILSKKAAAGSTHVVIDMPVGATAKVRDVTASRTLSALLVEVGASLGLSVRVVVSDGSQPVGRRIGPALEARDVLAALQNAPDGPRDLRARATRLAGEILELAGQCAAGRGITLAQEIVEDGRAWRKFQAICEAQGGMREPPVARYTEPVTARISGKVAGIDNRRLARVAKLAGAPSAPAAGLELHAPLGTTVARGEPLFTIHAETPGELAYALDYLAARSDVIEIAEAA
ncbi:MAG: thymidine phosphorylase family protein [Betaproteobacteria bacterium]